MTCRMRVSSFGLGLLFCGHGALLTLILGAEYLSFAVEAKINKKRGESYSLAGAVGRPHGKPLTSVDSPLIMDFGPAA